MYDKLTSRHYDKRRSHWAAGPECTRGCPVPIHDNFDPVVATILMREEAVENIQKNRGSAPTMDEEPCN